MKGGAEEGLKLQVAGCSLQVGSKQPGLPRAPVREAGLARRLESLPQNSSRALNVAAAYQGCRHFDAPLRTDHQDLLCGKRGDSFFWSGPVSNQEVNIGSL